MNNVQLRKFNFEHVIWPNYYFTRFIGLWPFSIIHDSNGNIQRARIGLSDMLWSILSICFYLTLAFYTYKKVKTAQEKEIENQLRFVVLNLFLMSSLLVGIFGIIFDMVNRNKLVDILRKFNTFDDEVRDFHTCRFPNQMKFDFRTFLPQKQISRFGVRFNYSRDCRVVWLYLTIPSAIALFFMAILVVILLHKDCLEFIRSISVNFLHFAIWISLEISFISFLRSLCQRFAALNFLLRYFPSYFTFIIH